MKEFIPPGYISLSDVVQRAAESWYPEDVQNFGLKPDEAELLMDYTLAEFKVESGIPACSHIDHELVRTTDKGLIETLWKRADRNKLILLEDTWYHLAGLLFIGSAKVQAIDDSTGCMHDVPGQFWGSEKGRSSYNSTSPDPWMVYCAGAHRGWIAGRPVLDLGCLEAILARGPAAFAGPVQKLDESSKSMRKHLGGAPRKFDPVAFIIEASKLLYDDLTPKNQAELRKAALDAYCDTIQANSAGTLDIPTDEWAKPWIRKLWNRLELGEQNNP